MDKLKYKTMCYYSKSDGSYVIFAPDLPGCFSDGKTVAEAKETLATIIDEWKETALEGQREIPAPLVDVVFSALSIMDVAQYILTKTGPISTMALQELLYYCQAWSLAWFHHPLFPEQFQAWKCGPVCRELFDVYKKNQMVSSDGINAQRQPSKSEKRFIDNVMTVYDDEDPEWLSKLTRSEAPWKETRRGLSDVLNSDKIIPQQLMEQFYAPMS